ncbi:MAG: hypothetical protein K8T25_09805 [Planctomycetia bacterium]|nr:hypothetical protein [Planctomycetia bacterium]
MLDFLSHFPEGKASYGDKPKDAIGVLTAFLAFIATQSGALTVADNFSMSRWLGVSIYVVLSVTAMCFVAGLLRLREPGHRNHYYYDLGTIVYGKFILLVSLIATIAFAVAYWYGLFAPNRERFADKTIPLEVPIVLNRHVMKSTALVSDVVNADDARTLLRFAQAMTSGLSNGKHNDKRGDGPNVYVTWSAVFKKDYDDFSCEIPKSLANSSDCLPFLYSTYRTHVGTTQIALRPIWFQISQKTDNALNILQVSSVHRGDRIVLVFWSQKGPPAGEKYELALK